MNLPNAFLILICAFIQFGCATRVATALQLPSRKSNPEHFTQDVEDDYTTTAEDLYRDLERATYIVVDGIVKDGARYDTKFFPITKPFIISNSNRMVLEKHISTSKRNQYRDAALKAFSDGKRCFQIWRSVSYIGKRTEKADRDWEERYWRFTALSKNRELPLVRVPEKEIVHLNVNPPGLPIYSSVVCASEDLDYSEDVSILSEISLYPNLNRTVTWKAVRK